MHYIILASKINYNIIKIYRLVSRNRLQYATIQINFQFKVYYCWKSEDIHFQTIITRPCDKCQECSTCQLKSIYFSAYDIFIDKNSTKHKSSFGRSSNISMYEYYVRKLYVREKSKLEIEEALLQYKITTWYALTAIFQNPSDTSSFAEKYKTNRFSFFGRKVVRFQVKLW